MRSCPIAAEHVTDVEAALAGLLSSSHIALRLMILIVRVRVTEEDIGDWHGNAVQSSAEIISNDLGNTSSVASWY